MEEELARDEREKRFCESGRDSCFSFRGRFVGFVGAELNVRDEKPFVVDDVKWDEALGISQTRQEVQVEICVDFYKRCAVRCSDGTNVWFINSAGRAVSRAEIHNEELTRTRIRNL